MMDASEDVRSLNVTSESQANVPNELNDKREELTDILRSRLIECGWRDQVASMCRDLIQKRGVDKVKLSDIISEVRQEARQKIPNNVRMELLDLIRKINQDVNT